MDFEVKRADIHESRVVDEDPPELAPGQALLRVDRFALTTNNVTYAVMGDALKYWHFFPINFYQNIIYLHTYQCRHKMLNSTNSGTILFNGSRAVGFNYIINIRFYQRLTWQICSLEINTRTRFGRL